MPVPFLTRAVALPPGFLGGAEVVLWCHEVGAADAFVPLAPAPSCVVPLALRDLALVEEGVGRNAGVDGAIHLAELVGLGRDRLRPAGILAEIGLHDLACGGLERRLSGLPSIVEVALRDHGGRRRTAGLHQLGDGPVPGPPLELKHRRVKGRVAVAIFCATCSSSSHREQRLGLPVTPHRSRPSFRGCSAGLPARRDRAPRRHPVCGSAREGR